MRAGRGHAHVGELAVEPLEQRLLFGVPQVHREILTTGSDDVRGTREVD